MRGWGGGVKLFGIKYQICQKKIGHPRLEKQERREGWLQERKEMERKERERKEGEGIFPWSLSLEIDNI